ncbi:substrate-binding domain-containing protein [Candidatus Saccharibacteria bacterium]|nr:substrate-binding domain-containing protein [Candidatus Saccharibacteria bacterium]
MDEEHKDNNSAAEDATTDAPVEETPTEEAPIEETPSEETPAEEAPVEEAPVEETPAEKKPEEDTPAEEPAPAEGPEEQAPAETPAEASATADEKPKKKFPWLAIIIIALALGSVVGVYFIIKANQKPEQVTVVDQPKETDPRFKADSKEVLFTKDTFPRIDASLATQPLTDAFAINFTGKTTTYLGVTYSNTHPSYVKLINNEADLIIVTEPSEDELKLAEEKGVELEVTKVVNEGFTFFVNKDNPVDNVKFDDLVKIYTGEITNWKDLDGNDAEIIAYQRPENSGSQTGLYNLVLKGKPVKIPTIKESVELTMAGIVDYVAFYDNGINSIGYGFYYYVNTMYYNENIKYLAVNGIKPTYETIQDGSYPILSAYYIVTRKGETNENVALLKQAMLSERGQKVASEAGYVPAKK